MRVSELLGCRTVTESGQRLGHVFDVRVKRDPRSSGERADQRWKLDALILGERGLIDRFGVLAIKRIVPKEPNQAVPWSQVLRIEPGQITVRDRARS
jgi:hypothetical protein